MKKIQALVISKSFPKSARAMKDKREYGKFFEKWKDTDEELPALIAAKKEYAKLM